MLTSTWLIYLKDKSYYLFDINEMAEFDESHRYSKNEFLEEFKNSFFEIDCEVS